MPVKVKHRNRCSQKQRPWHCRPGRKESLRDGGKPERHGAREGGTVTVVHVLRVRRTLQVLKSPAMPCIQVQVRVLACPQLPGPCGAAPPLARPAVVIRRHSDRPSAVSQALFPAQPAVPRSLLLTASVTVSVFDFQVLFLSQALSVSGLSVCLSLRVSLSLRARLSESSWLGCLSEY